MAEFRLFGGSVRSALVHAATQYDMRAEARARRSRHGSHSIYALGHYLRGIDEACAAIEAGATARDALLGVFNDRLLDAMLKAIGEPKFTADEARNQSVALARTIDAATRGAPGDE